MGTIVVSMKFPTTVALAHACQESRGTDVAENLLYYEATVLVLVINAVAMAMVVM